MFSSLKEFNFEIFIISDIPKFTEKRKKLNFVSKYL